MDYLAYMDLALEEAKLALLDDDVPVGAIIVKNGKIIAKAHNSREKDLDISGHAEINAIKEASRVLNTYDLRGCELIVTLEPCLMCAGAIKDSRISSIVYGAKDPLEGGISKYHIFDDNTLKHHPLIKGGVKEEECANLLSLFFKEKRK